MLKKTIISTLIISIVLFLSIIAISNSRGILFHEFPWLMPTALACGILTGIIRGILYDRVVKKMKQQPDRHTIDSFLEHWGTGVGIIVLMVSGFLIKADYNRFFY